jgi:hypothetical protein
MTRFANRRVVKRAAGKGTRGYPARPLTGEDDRGAERIPERSGIMADDKKKTPEPIPDRKEGLAGIVRGLVRRYEDSGTPPEEYEELGVLFRRDEEEKLKSLGKKDEGSEKK